MAAAPGAPAGRASKGPAPPYAGRWAGGTVCGGDLGGLRVAVATVQGRPYYRFAAALRRIGVRFDSILPGAAAAYGGDAVLTTRAEAPRAPRVPVMFEDACGLEPAVLAGRLLRCAGRGPAGEAAAGGGCHLLAGIDPGSRIGLSVSYGGCEIESSLHMSPAGVAARVSAIFSGLEAERRTVRIGSGSGGRMALQIAGLVGGRCGAPLDLEIVDERGTSPRSRSCNQGGRRDRVSALRISRRQGAPAPAVPSAA